MMSFLNSFVEQQTFGIGVAEVGGGEADDLFERFHEIMAILIAELQGDFTDILVGVCEQEFRQLHLLLQNILLQGDPGDHGEQMGEIFLIVAEVGGDLRYLDVFTAAPLDVVHNIVIELLLLRLLSGSASALQVWLYSSHRITVAM